MRAALILGGGAVLLWSVQPCSALRSGLAAPAGSVVQIDCTCEATDYICRAACGGPVSGGGTGGSGINQEASSTGIGSETGAGGLGIDQVQRNYQFGPALNQNSIAVVPPAAKYRDLMISPDRRF